MYHLSSSGSDAVGMKPTIEPGGMYCLRMFLLLDSSIIMVPLRNFGMLGGYCQKLA